MERVSKKNWGKQHIATRDISHVKQQHNHFKSKATNLSHVRCKNHSNVACIHLVVLFILRNICHQIDGPIKQWSFCWRKCLHQSCAVIFCVAAQHLFWCEWIKYPWRKLSKPCLQGLRRGERGEHPLVKGGRRSWQPKERKGKGAQTQSWKR